MNLGVLVLMPVLLMPLVFAQGAFSQTTFDFANDLSPTGTTTIKVMGVGTMEAEPDSMTVELEVYDIPTDDLSGVLDSQENTVESLISDLGQNYKVTRHNDRISLYQRAIADPTKSQYSADFRFPVKVQYEKFDSLIEDIVSAGFLVDNIKITEAPVGDVPPTGTANISIPHGTSMPGCEGGSSCFDPNPIDVTVGTSIIWTNDDEAAHTVTSGNPADGPNGLFDSGLITSGASFEYGFYQKGAFEYFCLVHPWMTGKVVVSEGEGKAPELGTFVEFDVLAQPKAETIQGALAYQHQKESDLAKILKDHGLNPEDIGNQPIRINDRFRMYSEPSQFQRTEYVTVQTSKENVASVIRAASDRNIRIDNIYSSYSDEMIKDLRPQLAHLALDDAKRNILDIIGDSGLQITGIKSIEINTSSMMSDRYNDQMVGGMFIMSGSPNQNAGNFYAKAEVEFEIGR